MTSHFDMPSLAEIKERIITSKHQTLPNFRGEDTEVVFIEYKGEEIFANADEEIKEDSITKDIGNGEKEVKMFGGKIFHLEDGKIFENKMGMVSKEEWEATI